ncbi:MAG: hypothetical protein LBU15_02635 [Rickettsiales bacterium]|jgi:serine/threonine protein kinase|nr:hypothetical protein [Rickettsiales bacterium]
MDIEEIKKKCEELDREGFSLELQIGQLLMSGCKNTFYTVENESAVHQENKPLVYQENDSIVYHIRRVTTVGAPVRGLKYCVTIAIPILSYRKLYRPVLYERERRTIMENAKVIGEDSNSLAYIFPSNKLKKDVVVRIPRFVIYPEGKTREGFGGFSANWTSDNLYFKSLWEPILSSTRPPELRNLEEIFDYGAIRVLPPKELAGYPKSGYPKWYPEKITSQSCGVGITVSEYCNLGPLGSMDRETARSILLANDNIYGLIRALCIVQDPNRPSGINCPHILIHGNINPKNLSVVRDEKTGVFTVKICSWGSSVAISPRNPGKDGENPFIFKLNELPDPDRRNDWYLEIEGDAIRAGNLAYTAPEIFKNGASIDTRKIDMFSLALVLFEMLALNGVWYRCPAAKVLPGIDGFNKLAGCAKTEEGRERWRNFIHTNLGGARLDPAIARTIELGCELDPEMRLAPEEVPGIRPKAVLHIDEEKGRYTITTLQTIKMPREEDVSKPIARPGGGEENRVPREGNIAKKSVLNKVVKASNAINGKGPGASGGGPGGGPGGLGGGPGGGPDGGAQGGLKPEGN